MNLQRHQILLAFLLLLNLSIQIHSHALPFHLKHDHSSRQLSESGDEGGEEGEEEAAEESADGEEGEAGDEEEEDVEEEEESEGGDENEEEVEGDGYGGGYQYQNDDGMGFFDFTDDTDWSESAIMPTKCFTSGDSDYIVYNLYKKNHNQCARKKKGTYKMPLVQFVKGYHKQLAQDSERAGGDYEVDEDVHQYLFCTPYYYNNAYFYLKIGCRESTGKGFQLKAYSDNACTNKMSSQYNLGIDISGMRVNFETCRYCVGTTASSNNYNYNRYYNADNGDYMYFRHESPLCSSAWKYRSSCRWGCRRGSSNKSSSSSSSKSSSSGSAVSYHDSFSPVEKFFLWALTINAFAFLLGSLALRKRQTKTEILLEETAIRTAGIQKPHIPRIILAVILFILCLVLFRRKILTWFFLIAANLAAMGYWFHLARKGKKNSSSSGFHAYNEGSMT